MTTPDSSSCAGDVKEGDSDDEVDAWFLCTRTCPTRWWWPWGPDSVGRNTTLPLLDDPPGRLTSLRLSGCIRFPQVPSSSTTTPRRGGSTATRGSARRSSRAGLADHVWTGPFIQTDFGPDRYTDQFCGCFHSCDRGSVRGPVLLCDRRRHCAQWQADPVVVRRSVRAVRGTLGRSWSRAVVERRVRSSLPGP